MAVVIGPGQVKTMALFKLPRQISLQAPSNEVMKIALGQGRPGNWVVVIVMTVRVVETEVVVSVWVETLVAVDSRADMERRWAERVADVLV